MYTASFVTNHPQMGSTKTYEDFYKFLGTRPTRLGILSRMYDDLTASYLTESLRNVVTLDSKSKDKFRPIDSMYFEWEIETNYIKRIELATDVVTDGANGTDVILVFKENYFQKGDIIKNDKSMQQFYIITKPIRKSDASWEVLARIIDTDYSSTVDLDTCKAGDTFRFQSNAMPEAHEEGFVKYQSNIEKHRNYITTFRVDDSYTALFAAHEDVFMKIANGDENGIKQETLYKMTKKEKNLLDNFMTVRNQGLLFNKSNIDANGKPTIMDPDLGRPIYIGDGIIPQIEKFASKYAFGKLTVDVFQTVLSMLNEKAEKPTGNKYMFICNEKMWSLVQTTLGAFLFQFRNESGSYMWSKKAEGYLSVGATFNCYEFGGNQITFKVDRTFTREYGTSKAYCMALDLTADATSGTPAMEMFTLKNGAFISNKYLGVGGENGLTSGVVSSPVAASKLINWGYAGIGVYNPYRSFILREI